MANELEQLVLKKAQSWLDGHYDEATKKQAMGALAAYPGGMQIGGCLLYTSDAADEL